MSIATNCLIEAEEMIRSTISGTIEQNRTIGICKLLFLNNKSENPYQIKCYKRDDKSIRFCIDRGNDCNKDKINTIFLCIKSNFQLGVLASEEKNSYLKQHDHNWNTISGPNSRGLSDKEIYEHVLGSFYTKMDKLGLSAHRPKKVFMDIAEKSHAHLQDNSYIPTKEDSESAYRILTPLGNSISIDTVLDQIEINAKKDGHLLKSDWRMITENNIEIWSKKM